MRQLVSLSPQIFPILVATSGERAGVRFLEFFAAQIRNPYISEEFYE
jgi:hypothetical protein